MISTKVSCAGSIMININLRTKREMNIAVVSVCCLVRDMRAVGMSPLIFKTNALCLILLIVLFSATICSMFQNKDILVDLY